MKLSRNTALGLLALFIVIALVAGVMFGASRSLQMASSERDFHERVRNSGEYARLAKRIEERADEIDAATPTDDELDAFYGSEPEGASDAAGDDPVSESTDPSDDSFLIGSTDPDEPVSDRRAGRITPDSSEDAQGLPPGW